MRNNQLNPNYQVSTSKLTDLTFFLKIVDALRNILLEHVFNFIPDTCNQNATLTLCRGKKHEGVFSYKCFISHALWNFEPLKGKILPFLIYLIIYLKPKK